MGQDERPAVPPTLMLTHPLYAYQHMLRRITAAVAVESYYALLRFARPHKPIRHTYCCCASTVRRSLKTTLCAYLLLIIGFLYYLYFSI